MSKHDPRNVRDADRLPEDPAAVTLFAVEQVLQQFLSGPSRGITAAHTLRYIRRIVNARSDTDRDRT